MVIESATEVTPELVAAVARLLPQLSTATEPPTAAQLADMVGSPTTRLLLARDPEGRIVGMLTLVWYVIPSERRGWIEDVVVDAFARRRGVGAALVQTALRLAAEAGIRTVYLETTAPRQAAARLYRRLGFETRVADLYRISVAAR